MSGAVTLPNGTTQMMLGKLFGSDRRDRSRKRAALEKVLAKLESTREKLENEITANNGSAPNRKRLEIRLRTNRKQREKTVLLLEALDLEGVVTLTG